MAFLLTPWQAAPARPTLAEDEVHLWRFPLVYREHLQAFLDEQELQRARRLRVPRKAQAFITARARLRQILARYLDQSPESLHFDYGTAGKPMLAGQMAEAPAFNLAHSGDWGLCAVAKGVAVGVDIERVDRSLDFTKLAAGFFSPTERNRLQACTMLRRRRLFFRIWTRKEAWLKGRGSGFSDPDQDLGTVHLSANCTHDGKWWLRSFPVTRHYLAALAVPKEFACLRRWEAWPPANAD
jgi:4'-phosphopantetheinyl transferase